MTGQQDLDPGRVTEGQSEGLARRKRSRIGHVDSTPGRPWAQRAWDEGVWEEAVTHAANRGQ